jgi:two-component system LytT family sensor kinase
MGDTKQVIPLRYAWAVWALLGLFSAGRLYVRSGAAGPPLPLASALMLGQVNAHLYFLATIPVFALAEHFRPGHGKRLARAPLYALGSVVFSAAVLSAQNAFQMWFSQQAGSGAFTPTHVAPAVLDKLDEGVYVFWLAVLVPCAYAYRGGRARGAFEPPPLEADPPHGESGTLRERLRPHFLFNTLNSIATLMHEDVKAAEGMLMNTSAFLRGALSESREVPLSFELDTLKGYLQMEAAGLGDEVSVRLDVDPVAERALVPTLLLLPLAEHAIKQGATRPDDGMRIEVYARREGDRLRIHMSNNCDGATAHSEASSQPGGGPAQTATRLSHLYGTFQRFEARYWPGVGFHADIQIPFRLRRLAADAHQG